MKNLKFKKDYYELLKELTDKQAGELTKGICAYAYERKPFLTKDDYLKGLFLYIKREIDVSEQNSANGKKGVEAIKERQRRLMANGLGVVIGTIMSACNEENGGKKE